MDRHTSSPCYATPHLGLVLCPHDGTSGKKVQLIGIEVQYIPGGCMYVCQTIDVVANKPFKSKMADLWEEWVDTENMKDVAEILMPIRKLLASWVVECYWMLDDEKCKNAFKKKGFK